MNTTDATDLKASPIIKQKMAAGFVAPYIGRIATHDVPGQYGLSLIRAGEVISETVAERAQRMGRLFELIASCDSEA